MASLRELQELFAESLISVQSTETSPTLFNQIKPHNSLGAKERLALYRRHTLHNHEQVLARAFPLCCRIVGDQNFRTITREYWYRYPSKVRDLNAYGAEMPLLLEVLTKEIPQLNEAPYLPDLARLEWAYWQSACAPDNKHFDSSAFSKVSETLWPTIIFQLIDSLNFLSVSYAVDELWVKVSKSVGTASLSVAINKESIALATWRDTELKLHHERISDTTFQVLTLIKEKVSLGEIINTIEEESENMPAIFSFLIQREWVSGYAVT